MTREILFRGKDNLGFWVYGDLLHVNESPCMIREHMKNWCKEYRNTNVSPLTVGQFTSLTDKNGVKIFEGDIVLQPVRETRKHSPCVVEFKNGKFMAHYNSERKFFDRYYDFNSYTKVVGNIHDNPGLLEV